ncbi:hypothetical protein HDU86_006189 [Geranomyces michiganensis]|nr:hypothetical protein HDU86_006189 [Geranomyces michiganensis]
MRGMEQFKNETNDIFACCSFPVGHMGLLTKWLLPFLHSQLDLAVAAAKQANAEQHLAQHSHNQHFTWPVRSPTLSLTKRGQVRKITSYRPDGSFPITMDIGDETHQMECAFGKACIDAYNAERAASLLCPLPPITTLRGAILVLHSGHLVITRLRSSRVARAMLVIERFTFIGNHGCEPTNRAEHVDDVRSVAARLALVAAWVDPIAAVPDAGLPAPPPAAVMSQSVDEENEGRDIVDGLQPVFSDIRDIRGSGPLRACVTINGPLPAAAGPAPLVTLVSATTLKEPFCDEWELQIVISDED